MNEQELQDKRKKTFSVIVEKLEKINDTLTVENMSYYVEVFIQDIQNLTLILKDITINSMPTEDNSYYINRVILIIEVASEKLKEKGIVDNSCEATKLLQIEELLLKMKITTIE